MPSTVAPRLHEVRVLDDADAPEPQLVRDVGPVVRAEALPHLQQDADDAAIGSGLHRGPVRRREIDEPAQDGPADAGDHARGSDLGRVAGDLQIRRPGAVGMAQRRHPRGRDDRDIPGLQVLREGRRERARAAAQVAEPIAGGPARPGALPDPGDQPGHRDVRGMRAELRLQHRSPDRVVAGSSEPARCIHRNRGQIHPFRVAAKDLGRGGGPEPDPGRERHGPEPKQVARPVERVDPTTVDDRHRALPPLQEVLHAEPAERRPRLGVLGEDVVVVRLDRLAGDDHGSREPADGSACLDDGDALVALAQGIGSREPGHPGPDHETVNRF